MKLNTVKVKDPAPLFCFQLFVSTAQHLFNLIISSNSRDQVLHLYICSKRKTLEYEIHWEKQTSLIKNNGRKKRQNHIFFCKILLSTVSHKTHKTFRKLLIVSEFFRAFPADHFNKKKHFEFHREMRDWFMVKILNTICLSLYKQMIKSWFSSQKMYLEKLFKNCKKQSLLTCFDGFSYSRNEKNTHDTATSYHI
jgi:hypothetical protein